MFMCMCMCVCMYMWICTHIQCMFIYAYINTYRRDEPDACATRRTHTHMRASIHPFYFISTHLPYTYACNVCTCKYPFVYMHLHDR